MLAARRQTTTDAPLHVEVVLGVGGGRLEGLDIITHQGRLSPNGRLKGKGALASRRPTNRHTVSFQNFMFVFAV